MAHIAVMERSNTEIPAPTRVGLVAYPHCQPAGLFAVADVLAILNLQLGAERFRSVWATAGSEVPLSWQGHLLKGCSPLEETDCDLWVVPPLWATDPARVGEVLAMARPVAEVLARRRGTFWSYCSGSMLLAQTGRMDGRRAATERWLHAFARQAFPGVRWEADSPLVHDGEFSSAAGLHGYFRILSEWIAETFGTDALRVLESAQFLPSPSREAGAFRPVDDTEVRDPRLRRLLHAARERAADSIDVRWAGEFLEMSARTFSRFVVDKTSLSPGEWLRRVKLRQVGQKLVQSDDPLKAVATELGYSSLAGLQRSFQQVTGFTPAQYRKLFGEREFRPPDAC